ncbi:MAG TPA: ABC transporter permease subunit [Candidatus Binatus sp.]|nr:ABC transporter permease subunit [Candidatus Binatus sp.]
MPTWLVSFTLIFSLWETTSLLGVIPADKLPPLHAVILTFIQLGGTPTFFARVGQSFANVALGITISLLVVLPLGLLVGLRTQLDQALTPVIMLVGALPDLAILTLLISVLGRGNAVAIAISGFSAFFPIYFTIRQGVTEIPADYFHVASIFKAGRVQTFTEIILPSIFPSMLTGLRLSFEFAWNVLLAVELIASVAGIGSFISSSLGPQQHSLTYGLAAIMTVGFVTLLMDRVFFGRLERRVQRWRP